MDEMLTITGPVELSDCAEYRPTMHLRWQGGVLMQAWESIAYKGGVAYKMDVEWRPIETVSLDQPVRHSL
jgi:hypothetical protein